MSFARKYGIIFLVVVVLFIPFIPVENESWITDVVEEDDMIYYVTTDRSPLLSREPEIITTAYNPSRLETKWEITHKSVTGPLQAESISANSDGVYIVSRCGKCSSYTDNPLPSSVLDTRHEIVAYDTLTGEQSWRSLNGSISSLNNLSVANETTVYVAGDLQFKTYQITAYDSRSGEIIWTQEIDTLDQANINRVLDLSLTDDSLHIKSGSDFIALNNTNGEIYEHKKFTPEHAHFFFEPNLTITGGHTISSSDLDNEIKLREKKFISLVGIGMNIVEEIRGIIAAHRA